MRGLTVAAIVAVALALLVILGLIFTGVGLKGSDRVFPNVCVLGVNLGGMKKAEAGRSLPERFVLI